MWEEKRGYSILKRDCYLGSICPVHFNYDGYASVDSKGKSTVLVPTTKCIPTKVPF